MTDRRRRWGTRLRTLLAWGLSAVVLALAAAACVHPARSQPPSAPGPVAGGPCTLDGVTPEPIAVAEAKAAEWHGRFDLPDLPRLWEPAGPDPVLADFRRAVRARLGAVDPRSLIERQRAVFARLPALLSGEAVNSALLLEGRAGRITPIGCLEAMLWKWQAARHPMLEHPTEFGAFVLRGHGRVRVYLSSDDRVGQRIRRQVTELVQADTVAGFHLLAHLHNHPFLFDREVGDRMWTTEETREDVAGALAPSMTDVQFYRNLRASHGLQEAWVTNGLDTARFQAGEFDRLKAP